MSIQYPKNKVLGAPDVKAFPKVQYEKIKEIIDAINNLQDGTVEIDTIVPPSGTLTVDGELMVTDLSTLEDVVITGSTSIQGLLNLKETPQTLTGAGAVNITKKITLLVTTGINALTLADGDVGQIKIIIMKTDGGDGTLTPTNLNGGTTITFSAVGQSATLLFIDGAWQVIGLVGAVLA